MRFIRWLLTSFKLKFNGSNVVPVWPLSFLPGSGFLQWSSKYFRVSTFPFSKIWQPVSACGQNFPIFLFADKSRKFWVNNSESNPKKFKGAPSQKFFRDFFNRWRMPGTPFGANLVSVVSKGSKFPISVKLSGKVAKVFTQVFLQKRNFSLNP